MKLLSTEVTKFNGTRTNGDAAQVDRLEVLAQQAALKAEHIPAHYLVTARHRPHSCSALKISP